MSSYQTAYLKRHFSAEFMAALLSSEIEDGNKRDIMVEHISDARKMGVDVVPPSINASDVEFTVKGKEIIFGLLALKGFGRQAAATVVRARTAGGPFKDLYDFCERIDQKIVNRAAVERLIKAGALDCLGGHRRQLIAALPRASRLPPSGRTTCASARATSSISLAATRRPSRRCRRPNHFQKCPPGLSWRN